MRKTLQRSFLTKFIENQTVPECLRNRTKRSTGGVCNRHDKKRVLEKKLNVKETDRVP
jgi:hypothetical protein